MSKGNIFMGQSRGKLGDIVQYRAGGQQRQRGYNSTNTSKSYGQQAQRSRLKSAYNYYKSITALLKAGFASGTAETSPYNRFMAKALPIAPYLVKQAAEAGNVIPAPFVIAAGSIPNVFEVATPVADGYLTISGLSVPSTGATVGDLYGAIVAKAPCLDGKALMLVGVGFNYTEDSVNGGYKHTRLINAISVTKGSTATFTSVGLSVGESGITFSGIDVGSTGSWGAFLVQKDGDKAVNASNANLMLTSGASTAYAAALTEVAARAAAESYGVDGGSCAL